jgi:hypothetical protein
VSASGPWPPFSVSSRVFLSLFHTFSQFFNILHCSSWPVPSHRISLPVRPFPGFFTTALPFYIFGRSNAAESTFSAPHFALLISIPALYDLPVGVQRVGSVSDLCTCFYFYHGIQKKKDTPMIQGWTRPKSKRSTPDLPSVPFQPRRN